MPAKRTIGQKKQEFVERWIGKLDDRLVDYTLNNHAKQQLICLINDNSHSLSKLFDEKICFKCNFGT